MGGGLDKSGFKILIIDDEPVVSQVLSAILDAEGYENPDTAESGEDGLEAIRRKEYHLVLVDKNLPGIDGLEVIQQAKPIWPTCEYVIVTGYGSLDTAIRAMELGAFRYLTKPFDDMETVAMIVEAALHRSALASHSRKLVDRLRFVNEALRKILAAQTADERKNLVEFANERLIKIIGELNDLLKGLLPKKSDKPG